VLSFDYGYTDEAVRLWAWNASLDDAISRLQELEEWEEWRKLKEEEKEVLKECLVKMLTEIWKYSWDVIRFVLSDDPQLKKYKDWKRKFSRKIIEKAMMRIAKISIVRHIGEQDSSEGICKENDG